MNTLIPSNTPVSEYGRPRVATTPEIASAELFKAVNEVVIRHDGQDYRLRITRQNKLILTK